MSTDLAPARVSDGLRYLDGAGVAWEVVDVRPSKPTPDGPTYAVARVRGPGGRSDHQTVVAIQRDLERGAYTLVAVAP